MEVFAPNSVISPASSPPYDFSDLHHPERGKEQAKSWLYFLILSVNPNNKSAIMIFPYAPESNCLELVLSQAMEVIPVYMGPVPIFISQFC